MEDAAKGDGRSPDHRSLEKRLQDRDLSVLDDILRAFGPLIQGSFRRKFEGGLNYHDIEDILAYGIGKLWRKPDGFDPEKGSIQAYFVAICLNRSLDTLRSKWHRARRREVHLGDKVNEISACGRDDAGCPADDGLLQTKEIQDLIECVERLKPSWQQIIWSSVCGVDEYGSSQSLAKELNVAESTIRVRKMRALSELRQGMSDRGHEQC